MEDMNQNYLKLYADIVNLEVKDLFTLDPNYLEDDFNNRIRNPKGDIKANIDACLNEIGKINPRYASAMVLRYGLDGNGKRTYKQVGCEIENPVTLERARQMIAKVLRMLHHPRRLRFIAGISTELNPVEPPQESDTKPDIFLGDIKQMDTSDRQITVKKFIIDILMEMTVHEVANDCISLSVRSRNCLDRSAMRNKTMDELLLYGGYDFKSIRNCGVKAEKEIKDAIANWASGYIGFVTYDELVKLLNDNSNAYVKIVNQQRTKDRIEKLVSGLKKRKLSEFMPYINGSGCCSKNRQIKLNQALYFMNTLHCYNMYDLFMLDQCHELPESRMVRDQDRNIINNIIDDWCTVEKVDLETLRELIYNYDISGDMKLLRRVEGVISSYFSGPNSKMLMDKYSGCRIGHLNIWNVSDLYMYERITKWLDILTPRVMNNYWGFVDKPLFHGGDDAKQEEWVNRELETDADRELVSTIKQMFDEKGFTISLEQATFLWVTYSVKTGHKDWVDANAMTEDEIWLNIIGYVFIDHIMLNDCARL